MISFDCIFFSNSNLRFNSISKWIFNNLYHLVFYLIFDHIIYDDLFRLFLMI